MAEYNDNTVMLEGARIFLRNFAGKEGRYNKKGDRNFGVLLDDETAQIMTDDGWNVKWLKPREENEAPQAFIKVKVKYGKGRPPRVVLIGSRGRTTLDEETIELADWVDIRSVDLMIRPYSWDVSGDTGISAYLKSMYIIVEESELDVKYSEIEEVAR